MRNRYFWDELAYVSGLEDLTFEKEENTTMYSTDARRPCPECGSAATIPEKYESDSLLSVCTHCQLTFSPGTPDWPDDLKLANFNAHPLTRDVVGHMHFEDRIEFGPERMLWAFATLDPMIRAHAASTWMEYARLAPNYAGGTVFDTRDVAMVLHSQAADTSDVTEEEVAQVTEEERQQAISSLEDWIFNNGVDWPDRLREDFDLKQCDWCERYAVDACDFHNDFDEYLCADCAKKCCVTCSRGIDNNPEEHDGCTGETLFDRDGLVQEDK